MTGKKQHGRDDRSSLRRPGREAGFSLTRQELEKMAASELEGVVVDAKLLSNGGLWVTFLAREPCCGARALLNVRARAGLDDETIDEVFRAAGRGRDLRHPAVLSTRRFGRTDDLLWITTRAYRGRLLRLSAPSRPAAGRARALDFLRRVAGPLEAVHRDGLVHGALSDASFHCDTEGLVRIRNLGYDVPLLRSQYEAGTETPTVACAAPEVLDGAVPEAESDQYALAALVVRAMTGRGPDVDGDVPWQEIPSEMRRPLRRALRLDPEERFPSVLAMWEALDPEGEAPEKPAGARGFRSPRPDDEVPGAPSGAAVEGGIRPRPTAGPRGHDGDRAPPPRPKRPSRPAARAPEPGRVPAPGDRWPPPRPEEGWSPFRATRRRRGRNDRGGSGAWGRTLAAAAVLILFFGTLEVVDAWSGGSPLSASLDSLIRTATADRPAPDVGGALLEPEPSSPDRAVLDTGTRSRGDGARSTDAETVDEELTRLDAIPDAPPTATTDEGETTPANAEARPVTAPPDDERDLLARTSDPGGPPQPTSASSSAASAPTSTIAPLVEERADTPAPGFLSLHTYPWGQVYLDGDYVGNSPIVEMRVSAGPHEIRIERDGYRPHIETVTVEPGQLLRRTGIVLSSGVR